MTSWRAKNGAIVFSVVENLYGPKMVAVGTLEKSGWGAPPQVKEHQNICRATTSFFAGSPVSEEFVEAIWLLDFFVCFFPSQRRSLSTFTRFYGTVPASREDGHLKGEGQKAEGWLKNETTCIPVVDYYLIFPCVYYSFSATCLAYSFSPATS